MQKATTALGKYDDYSNIVISGGTWDGEGTTNSIIKIGHMTGLTIQNVTFEDTSSPHMVEIAACKDVDVTGCTFQDSRHPDTELEAFQIDTFHEGKFTYSRDPVYDDYCCEDVAISGCAFRNLYRGFGSHGAVAGAYYYNNISVDSCVFEDIKNTAIMCTMWMNSSITNNTITNVGRGIDTSTYYWYLDYPTDSACTNVDALSYSANMTIAGNTISIGGADRVSSTWSGILLSGYYSTFASDTFPAGLYTVRDFNINNNVINGYNEWTTYSADEIYSPIYTTFVSGSNISSNTLTQGDYGILVQGGSEASNIAANHFAGETSASIAVRGGGSVSDMSANVLTMDCPYGIYADDTTTCNGTCEVAAYTVGAGDVVSTRTSDFSFFTNDLSTKVKGTYESSKIKVAKATKAGKIKGIKKGTSVVTASWTRGSGTVNVRVTAKVKKEPKKVKIPQKKKIKKGSTYQLNPKVNKGSCCTTYTYKSSNKKVAKVSKTGLITAKKKGTATITVTAYNGVSATITVTVKK